MKNLGLVLTVGITAVILSTIGVFNFLLAAAEEPAPVMEAAPPPAAAAAVGRDAGAVQAAYAARESLLQSQIADLDSELVDRQAAYEQQLQDYGALLISSEGQLAQLEEQEIALQEQIDQLLVAQTERAAFIEGQRQQAYYQYQVTIQQLQAQLDEGNAKLAEARARLGQ